MSPRARKAWQALAAIAVLAAVAAIFAYVPILRESLATLAHLEYGWLILALAEAGVSMGAFARSTRRLLQVSGTLLPLRAALAITYASNALAISVPVAGAGLGTAYTFRQLRRHGIDTAAVSWALTLSGVVSSLAFAAVMLAGVALTNDTGAALVGVLGVVLNALPALTVLAALRFRSLRSAVNRAFAWLVRLSRRLFRHPAEKTAGAFEALLERIAGLNATPLQYLLALGSSVRNWIADCLCLAFSILATGTQVPWRGLLLAYCLAKSAGSLGLTPGGVGVVEVTLAAALTNAGMPAAKALPAALLYRLISFWLVVAVGWVLLATLRRTGARRLRRDVASPTENGPESLP